MATVQEFLPLLHSKDNAARILGIGKRTVDSLIKSKKLRAVRVGRRVLIAHSELVKFCGRCGE